MSDALNKLGELILKWLPHPLRLPLTVSLLIFIVTMESVKIYEGFGWRGTFSSWEVLAGCSLLCFYWSHAVWRHMNRPDVSQFGRLSLPLFFLVALITSFTAGMRWHYRYNALGFYEQRSWWRVSLDKGRNTSTLDWELIAASEETLPVLVIDINTNREACPKAQISSFHPEEIGSFGATATEISWQTPDHRGWKVEGFRRPARFRFLLEITSAEPDVARCYKYDVHVGG